MGIFLESIFIEVLCVLLLVLWMIFLSVTEKYSFWKERGIVHIKPEFPFGTLKDSFLGKRSIGQIYEEYYHRFKNERFFGVHEIRKPILIVKDPDLIKLILTKDFNHFTDRFVFPIDKKEDYISMHLFNMTGQDWRNMRMNLTPTFSSGKMKMMFVLMAKCGEQLREHVNLLTQFQKEVDIKDVLVRFTMDIIATCAFGLEINSMSNKESEFYIHGMKIFKPSIIGLIKRIITSMVPLTTKLIHTSFVSKEVSTFLTRIVQETVEYREKNNVYRNDFLDLLIRIRQNQNLNDDKINEGRSESQERNSKDKGRDTHIDNIHVGLTTEEMTAQAFIFFAAGFETASSTMTFCLYELACNPGIQDKLRSEINNVLINHNGKLSYQSMQEMTYMDQVINEILRRYASLPTLNRTCSEPYKIKDSDLVLEKGQKVTIPIFAIHHDPKYYPDPYKFDPERFTKEQIRERHPYLHLPFGEGPRMCIGMRFGLLQTKIGLTEMVSNFEFGLAPNTKIPMPLHKRSFVTQPESPIILSVKAVKRG